MEETGPTHHEFPKKTGSKRRGAEIAKDIAENFERLVANKENAFRYISIPNHTTSALSSAHYLSLRFAENRL